MVLIRHIKKLRWSSSSVSFECWWSLLDVWPAWSIHKEIVIGKRNQNGQFPHRNRVEYIPSVWKNSLLMNTFEWAVRRWFCNSQLKESGCQRLSSRSFVTQRVCLKVSIWHCRIEWKWIELVTHTTRDYVHLVTDWLGMKNQVLSFSTSVISTENKEKKIDQMMADKWHYLFILTTAIGAFFQWPEV